METNVDQELLSEVEGRSGTVGRAAGCSLHPHTDWGGGRGSAVCTFCISLRNELLNVCKLHENILIMTLLC